MDPFIEKILSFKGNKYEATVAMCKYARLLSQKNEDLLEIPLSNHSKEKVTILSIRDVLSGKTKYILEQPGQEK
jgi:DNA-directed RNA polymerase subunit K/omega